jgi:hypothetical protein
VKGVEKALCEKCGKWAPTSEWYHRDGEARLYAHKPCERARSVDSHERSKAKAKRKKK